MNLPNNAKVVIAGGSGFLGRSLAEFLTGLNVRVIVLSRRPTTYKTSWATEYWDGKELGDWRYCLNDCWGLVNLTGRSVDCIKNAQNSDEILRSRIDSTLVLGKAMRAIENPPPVWVQMSTAHIYGDPPDRQCTETTSTGTGFAPDVGRQWENAFKRAALDNQRRVIMRTSFVLGKERGAGGGALSRLRFVARIGLGGRIGTGRQGMSWIHEVDLNRFILQAISDPIFSGVYNLSSPNAASQAEFMQSLCRRLKIPIALPAADWMVRLGARWIMKTDPELAIHGRFITPKRLLDGGFKFEFADLNDALADVLD